MSKQLLNKEEKIKVSKNLRNKIFRNLKHIPGFEEANDIRIDKYGSKVVIGEYDNNILPTGWTLMFKSCDERVISESNIEAIAITSLNIEEEKTPYTFNSKRSMEINDNIVKLLNQHKWDNKSIPIVAIAYKDPDDPIEEMFIENNIPYEDAVKIYTQKQMEDRHDHAEQILLNRLKNIEGVDPRDYYVAISIPPCNRCMKNIAYGYKKVFYVMDKKAAIYLQRDVDYLSYPSHVFKYTPKTTEGRIAATEMEFWIETTNLNITLARKLERINEQKGNKHWNTSVAKNFTWKKEKVSDFKNTRSKFKKRKPSVKYKNSI